MEAYQRTVFTSRGLAVHTPSADSSSPSTVELDLLSGEMHYWRMDRRDWRACLLSMKDIGLWIVSTYVPWSVHEDRLGRYDWSDDLDLGAFLDLVHSLGMRAIVKPGPHINAELTLFGFPERILRNTDILAVTGRDTPAWLPMPARMFPVPSYASQVFRDEVTKWFVTVGGVVASRLAPTGPVIAVQVDNEAHMFFRMGAYDLDYHPDALSWWHEFSGGADAPRAWSPSDAERCVDWVRFKHEYTARSLSWLCAALDQAGITGIARFHNLPPSDPSHVDLSPRAHVSVSGVVGMDFYHHSADYSLCRRRALYLTGSADLLPFAPEVGVGGPPWLLPMSIEDQQNTLLNLLSAGVRAFNLYMMVERERWYGGAVNPSGDTQPHGVWLKTLLASLRRVNWTSLRRPAPVALIWSRADARFGSASSVADPLTPVLSEFVGLGPSGSAELALDRNSAEHRRWLIACESALDLAGVPYDIVDEGAPADRLASYRAVIVPTLERVDRGLWRTLHALASTDTVVVVGPEQPSLDHRGVALGDDAGLPARAGLIRVDSIDDLNGFADDLTDVASSTGELPGDWLAETDDIDCTVFVGEDEQPVVLFVANRSAKQITAELSADGVSKHTRLIDPLAMDTSFAIESDLVSIPLKPYQLRVLIIDTSGD